MNHRSLISAIILVGALAMSCASGSRNLVLTGSPDVPGAKGTAKVSSTDDGNTKIDLAVQHLAPPEDINSGATVYVVWVQGGDVGAEPHNLGALKVDSDLNGSMTAVTNLRSFDLYVTAEPSQATTTPTGKTLLRTNVLMKSLNES
jgi:hypothetical protein